MSNTDRNQRIRQEASAIRSEPQASDGLKCQADALKSLLNTIVDQISEADKRHADALSQMQDRLSGLGADARAMRKNAPDDYQLAFERIEAGMRELAGRLAEIKGESSAASELDDKTHDFGEPVTKILPMSEAHMPVQPPLASHASHSESHEPPVALRSAQQPDLASRRREESPAKVPAGVDTFDVIESLPGDASDPWDHQTADALANVYSSDIPTFPDDEAYATSAGHTTPRVYAPGPGASADMGGHGDQIWLDKRLSEIAERIEASIADLGTDQSFFALGQRIDQIERNFADILDNVATHSDLDSVRLIEQHMAELITHLETMHNQMARLETIEHQVASVAARLEEGPQSASSAGSMADIASVAKAVAAEAATHFASMAPGSQSIAGLDEMRALIERSSTDARQSDENTAALLDTLQQAMIRLLDRMDAIEVKQKQEPKPAAAFGDSVASRRSIRKGPMSLQDSVFESEEFHVEPPASASERGLDAVAAAVASETATRNSRSVPQQAPAEPETSLPLRRAPRGAGRGAPPMEAEEQNPDKVRQDFIADARRAKMRLASEEGSDQIVLTNAAVPLSVEDLPPSQRPAGKVQKPSGNEKSASILNLRTAVLALALLGAVGAWFFLGAKKPQQAAIAPPPVAAPTATKDAKPSAAAPEAAPKKAASEAATGKAAPKAPPAASGGEAPPPDANFQKRSGDPELPSDQVGNVTTVGKIVSGDENTATAEIPLAGVAIATDQNASAADVIRAHRQNAMATVSGKLGQVAGEAGLNAVPTALVPENQAAAAPANTEFIKSGGALDLPPATVGPLSLRLAAANGDPSAEFEVGARLAEGKGTDQNFKEAAKWYQRSASKGFVQAQYRLGTLYERGLGLKGDEERAKDWYQRAAEQGNVKAMHNLAVLSANSRSGTPDYALAAKWFSEAAEHGLPDSQFNLAVLYENGLGVTGDLRQSYKWLFLAARNGDKEAIRRRDILKGKLTADEISQAEALIKAFQPQATDQMANDARTAGEAWKRNPANGQSG